MTEPVVLTDGEREAAYEDGYQAGLRDGEARAETRDESFDELTDRLAAERAAHEALREAALSIAYEHAATVDGEWGCCHDEDALRAGGRAPSYDGDEFEPLPDDCDGVRVLNRHLAALAATVPTPPESAAKEGGL